MAFGHLALIGFCGAIAGLVAAGIMEIFQLFAGMLFKQDSSSDSDDEPSPVMAAKAIAGLFGKTVPKNREMLAGRIVHYVTGAGLGKIYAIAALYCSCITIGFGAAFGVAIAILLDWIVVPVAGWSKPFWKTPFATHAYSFASHIVFGLALEGGRRILVGLLVAGANSG